MEELKTLIDELEGGKPLSKDDFVRLIKGADGELSEYLFEKARRIARKHFGNQIYTRGLIEFTNYCRNDCYYCGIRKSNGAASRYHLTAEEILECCASGYELGFRTFVLQGGEDGSYSAEDIADIVRAIKARHPDCAVTLSIGEWDRAAYEQFYAAGADRYLLRHETADRTHYRKLHPENLKLENRMDCLRALKAIGFQTGTGFMVGSPGQTAECLAEDLLFIRALSPHMVGIGPFIPHQDTPFAEERQGTLEQTLFLIGLLRLMLPKALLPSTTALGTIDPEGREKGILAGANVVMPNLSPLSVRKKYMLYDNKICTGEEAAECRFCLQGRMNAIGYELAVDRGDYREEEHPA